VVALGKVLPFGIGAAVGGSSNFLLTRQVGHHADKFFNTIGT
jgi:hypothetical protein